MKVCDPSSLAMIALLMSCPTQLCAEPIRLELARRSVSVSLRTPEGGLSSTQSDKDSLRVSVGGRANPTAELRSNLSNPARIVANGSVSAESTSTHTGSAGADLAFYVGFDEPHAFRLFVDVVGGEESSEFGFAGVEMFFRDALFQNDVFPRQVFEHSRATTFTGLLPAAGLTFYQFGLIAGAATAPGGTPTSVGFSLRLELTPEPPAPIPEPATLTLLGIGLAATGWRARWRRNR
jgi:hypothetical protein